MNERWDRVCDEFIMLTEPLRAHCAAVPGERSCWTGPANVFSSEIKTHKQLTSTHFFKLKTNIYSTNIVQFVMATVKCAFNINFIH